MYIVRVIGIAIAAALVASPALAQQDSTHGTAVSAVAKTNSGKAKGAKKGKKAELKALAKISKDSARVVALSRVPAGSKVREAELERENGNVVYSFDIKVPNKTGVEEVQVSAIDGSVVSQTHESAKQEKAEKAKEKAEAKKP
jgi:uncharacterized membrane protein YkoI